MNGVHAIAAILEEISCVRSRRERGVLLSLSLRSSSSSDENPFCLVLCSERLVRQVKEITDIRT